MAAVLAPSVESRGLHPSLVRLIGTAQQLAGWVRRTGLHGVWIALWSLIGWAGTLAAPFLADEYAFLLMCLAPRAIFVVLAIDQIDFFTFVLAGTIRLGVTDASYFIIGRRFPRPDDVRPRGPARNLLTRARRFVLRGTDALCRWLCGNGAKAGTVLFLRPNAKYLAVAGSYGVSASIAGWSSVLGTVTYLSSMYLGLGALL